MRGWVLLLVWVSALVGCLDVADERAKMDLQIGQSQIDSAQVSVLDGLASVQRFEQGELELWGGAPTLDVTLQTQAGGTWVFRVRNAMADAELSASVAGAPLDAEVIEEPLPTVKAWRLELPESAEVSLKLATPDERDTAPFRFVIFADIQDRIDGVQDIYDRMKEVPDVRFGLISGDLTNQGAPEELVRFKQEMESLPFPLFATLGNHELGNGDHVFQQHFGRGNYSFVFRGVRFTMLDSASATIAPVVYDWLGEWLADSQGGLHLAIMHIPPLDPAGQRNGAFASRAEANKLLGMLARGGVDMTVYGHVHSFYAFSNAGIEACISGGGGAIPQRLDGIGRHFLSIEANPETQRFTNSVIRVFPED